MNDTSRSGSMVEQVAADLTRRLQAGEFAVGELLPSRRQLQQQYAHLSPSGSLSATVIAQAQIMLTDVGLVQGERGRGVRVLATTVADDDARGAAVIGLDLSLDAGFFSALFPSAGGVSYLYAHCHPRLVEQLESLAPAARDSVGGGAKSAWTDAARRVLVGLEDASRSESGDLTSLQIPSADSIVYSGQWVLVDVPMCRITTDPPLDGVAPADYLGAPDRYVAVRTVRMRLASSVIRVIASVDGTVGESGVVAHNDQ